MAAKKTAVDRGGRGEPRWSSTRQRAAKKDSQPHCIHELVRPPHPHPPQPHQMRTCTTPWTYPLEPYIPRGARMNPPTPPNADLHHTLDIPLGALYPTGSPYEPYFGAGSVGTGSADLGLIWLSFAGGKSGAGSVGTLWGQRCTQQCSQRVHVAPRPNQM